MNIEEAIKALDNLKHEGNLVSLYAVKEIISQIKQEKVIIPKYVADWIERTKGYNNLYDAMEEISYGTADTEILEWFCADTALTGEILARAWLDGYEIEQEKLYTVEIPNPNIDKGHITVLKRVEDNTIELCIFIRPDLSKSKFHLTESEIRKDFEWAWKEGFAKPVEEDWNLMF